MKLILIITQNKELKSDQLETFLDLVLSNNCLRSFETMKFTLKSDYSDYTEREEFNTSKWMQYYLNQTGNRSTIVHNKYSHEEKTFMEIGLVIENLSTHFYVRMDYEPGMDHEKVKDFFKDLYRLMPGADVAYLGLKEARDHYLDVLDAPNLPPAFNNELNWIQIVNPVSYKMFDMYRKEDILKAPAYLVEELEDDFIYMESYSDPFAFESDGDNVLKLANYLLSKAKPISL